MNKKKEHVINFREWRINVINFGVIILSFFFFVGMELR